MRFKGGFLYVSRRDRYHADMPLIYAGIDEAGYGPLLGPLCVGLSVFRVDAWKEGEPAPNLWTLLSRSVCREPGDKRGRVAVDDSKNLKLANSSSSKHPLTHLERGVLSFLLLQEGAADRDWLTSDVRMLAQLGAKVPDEPWYAGAPGPCPVGNPIDAFGLWANTLRVACEEAGVGVLSLTCESIGERVFNELVRAAGTKAAATESALVRHLWTVWDRWGGVGAQPDGGVRVICDRQGGRTNYLPMLTRAFPGVDVRCTHESDDQSRYELRGVVDGQERHMHVLYLVESERQHLPVALASMAAKLVRETLMARFNRFWCERLPELKPTAGYRNDAWRWLEDAKSVIRDDERIQLIRRA